MSELYHIINLDVHLKLMKNNSKTFLNMEYRCLSEIKKYIINLDVHFKLMKNNSKTFLNLEYRCLSEIKKYLQFTFKTAKK